MMKIPFGERYCTKTSNLRVKGASFPELSFSPFGSPESELLEEEFEEEEDERGREISAVLEEASRPFSET